MTQPLHVRLHEEDMAVVNAGDFVDAVGEEKSAVIDRYARGCVIDVFAIQIYEHVLFSRSFRWS